MLRWILCGAIAGATLAIIEHVLEQPGAKPAGARERQSEIWTEAAR